MAKIKFDPKTLSITGSYNVDANVCRTVVTCALEPVVVTEASEKTVAELLRLANIPRGPVSGDRGDKEVDAPET